MKKLLIMAFAVLTVSAFAAEENRENTTNAVENRNIEATHILEAKDIANVQVQEMSLGESFMAAFGMLENSSSATINTANGSTATNAGVVNSNNSVTIITPYGKY